MINVQFELTQSICVKVRLAGCVFSVPCVSAGPRGAGRTPVKPIVEPEKRGDTEEYVCGFSSGDLRIVQCSLVPPSLGEKGGAV
jgi:hypothetical protein